MFLPNDIADLILGFLPDYELLEWIDFKSLSWPGMSINPNLVPKISSSVLDTTKKLDGVEKNFFFLKKMFHV